VVRLPAGRHEIPDPAAAAAFRDPAAVEEVQGGADYGLVKK